MNKTIKMYSAAFFAAVLILCSFALPKKEKLRFNLKEGQTYKLRTTADQTITQTVMNMEQKIKQTIASSLRYHVLKNDGELMTINVSYETFSYKMDMQPYFSMDYDSESKAPRENPFYNFLDKMIGKDFKIKMDSKGEVKEVEGLEETLQAIIDETEVANPQQKEAYAQQLKQLMGEENFKKSFEVITAIYPDQAVAEGDTWSKEMEMETGMPVQYFNKYTLTERNKKQSTIGLDAQVTSKSDGDADGNQYDLKGTQKGTITVDSESGWISKSDVTNKLNGMMKVKNEQVPEGMDIPVTIVSHVITESYN